jgi:hypothetical protein
MQWILLLTRWTMPLQQRERLRAVQQKPKVPRVRNWNIVEDTS